MNRRIWVDFKIQYPWFVLGIGHTLIFTHTDLVSFMVGTVCILAGWVPIMGRTMEAKSK